MALAKVTNQRETDKFVLNSSDETAIRTVSETKETAPTDDSKNNGSLVIEQDDMVEDSTQDLTKTIGAVSYLKTLSKNAAGDLIGVSSWSEV